MNVSSKTMLASVIMGSLVGCVSFSDDTRLCADDQGEFYTCNDLTVMSDHQAVMDSSLYSAPLNFQLLSDYTEQMTAELQKDLASTIIKEKIVVASFVYLDSSLRVTSRLGNQLAESFIQDLQSIGLPVSEHRLADEMSISAAGMFVLRHDRGDIEFGRDIGYVLVGTLVENNRGLVVNTRLVNTKTHKVSAAASKLFPNAVFAGI